MSEDAIETAALELREAYKRGPIAPIVPRLVPAGAESGYVVQDVNTRFWQEQGRRIVGAKIGLTSAAVRAQIGVDEPDFGVLFEDMRVEDGGLVDQATLMQPRLEAEIAFRMGSELPDAEISRGDIIAATASVSAAIEIVASRIEGWRCSIADTVADNASAGLFVLGNEAHELAPDVLPSLTMSLSCDGKVVSQGVGAASMGDPVEAVLWLARTLARWGRPLQAGDIVLSGALGPLVDAVPGGVYRTDIEHLGSASVRFVP